MLDRRGYCTDYRGISIEHGGPMFVAFVGNPCQRIHISTNVYVSICLIFIYKIQMYNLILTKLRPYESRKIIPQYLIRKSVSLTFRRKGNTYSLILQFYVAFAWNLLSSVLSTNVRPRRRLERKSSIMWSNLKNSLRQCPAIH